jgi:hypothetical protein
MKATHRTVESKVLPTNTRGMYLRPADAAALLGFCCVCIAIAAVVWAMSL